MRNNLWEKTLPLTRNYPSWEKNTIFTFESDHRLPTSEIHVYVVGAKPEVPEGGGICIGGCGFESQLRLFLFVQLQANCLICLCLGFLIYKMGIQRGLDLTELCENEPVNCNGFTVVPSRK